MITTYITTVLVILGILALWITTNHLARLFASRHPELGPLKEDGSGCGGLCRCDLGETCPKKELLKKVGRDGPARRTTQ